MTIENSHEIADAVEERCFPLGEILTVTTEKLVARNGMSGVCKILNFVTGDDVYTHQIPRAMRTCKPHLLTQFPQFTQVEVPHFEGDGESRKGAVSGWLTEQEAEFGTTLSVRPIPAGAYEHVDPVEELQEMVGDRSVIAVVR